MEKKEIEAAMALLAAKMAMSNVACGGPKDASLLLMVSKSVIEFAKSPELSATEIAILDHYIRSLHLVSHIWALHQHGVITRLENLLKRAEHGSAIDGSSSTLPASGGNDTVTSDQ